MSATTQRLKAAVIEYMAEVRPDETIEVVDAKQRTEIDLPTLAVDILSVEPHSVVLAHVQRIVIALTLRCHAGDESDQDIDGWSDQIESALNDPSSVKTILDDGVRIDHWLYQGSEQSWDENIHETTFSVECLAYRV